MWSWSERFSIWQDSRVWGIAYLHFSSVQFYSILLTLLSLNLCTMILGMFRFSQSVFIYYWPICTWKWVLVTIPTLQTHGVVYMIRRYTTYTHKESSGFPYAHLNMHKGTAIKIHFIGESISHFIECVQRGQWFHCISTVTCKGVSSNHSILDLLTYDMDDLSLFMVILMYGTSVPIYGQDRQMDRKEKRDERERKEGGFFDTPVL